MLVGFLHFYIYKISTFFLNKIFVFTIKPNIRPDIRYPAKPDIRPDIYPAKLLAGYPAKSVTGTTLLKAIVLRASNWSIHDTAPCFS